jgi:hypothetical protein
MVAAFPQVDSEVHRKRVPYLPFAEALGPLAASGDREVVDAVRSRPPLGRLVPQIQQVQAVAPGGSEHVPLTTNERETMQPPRPEQDLGQLQLFDAVLGVLTEIAESRPAVILLEDLHWADGSTRNLLSFLVSRLRAQRLLVVREQAAEWMPPVHVLVAVADTPCGCCASSPSRTTRWHTPR